VRTAARDVCELCAAPLADEHGHLVDLHDRRLLCACRPCALLFVDGAAQGRFRAVPTRYRALDAALFDDAIWEGLQIPIGLAFFFRNSAQNRMVAFYPGPGGTTESLLPLGAWEELEARSPSLSALEPDVEAVLVRRPKGAPPQAYLVPIDVCYELTGRLRTTWSGIDGGDASRDAIDALFARLARNAS
jgi:hypothetical protein